MLQIGPKLIRPIGLIQKLNCTKYNNDGMHATLHFDASAASLTVSHIVCMIAQIYILRLASPGVGAQLTISDVSMNESGMCSVRLPCHD